MPGFNLDLPTQPLQTAIHDRLVNDGIKVFDEPVEKTEIDYVVVGDADVTESEEFRSKQTQAYTCTVNLDCYSQQRGMKTVNQLAAAVADSLTTSPLTVSGWNLKRWILDSHSPRRDQANTGIPIRSGELRLTFSLTK